MMLLCRLSVDIVYTSSLTGLSDSLLKTAQVIMLANLGKKINIPASDLMRNGNYIPIYSVILVCGIVL